MTPKQEQCQRLKLKIQQFRDIWKARHERIGLLEHNRSVETRVEEQLRQDLILSRERAELQKLENDLDNLVAQEAAECNGKGTKPRKNRAGNSQKTTNTRRIEKNSPSFRKLLSSLPKYAATAVVVLVLAAAGIGVFMLWKPSPEDRYAPYSDGTARDNETGLMWMRCSLGQTWNGKTCTGEAKKFTWEQAKQQTSNFAGYRDWRLPTIQELRPLLYCSSGEPEFFRTGEQFPNCDGDYKKPTIVEFEFPNTPMDFFWSSSAYADYSDYAWGAYFNFGNDGKNKRSDSHHVRLVRGGQ